MLFEMFKFTIQRKMISTTQEGLIYIGLLAFWLVLTVACWFLGLKILFWFDFKGIVHFPLLLLTLVLTPILTKVVILRLFEPLAKGGK